MARVGRVAVLVLLLAVTQAVLGASAFVQRNVTAACNMNGYTLVDGGACVCLSGFSHSDCSVAHNPTSVDACPIAIANNEHQVDYVYLDSNQTTWNHTSVSSTANKFFNNTLFLGLRGKFFNNRQFNSVGFKDMAADSNCTLGVSTSYWTQDVDTCEDTFFLTMPWAQHDTCGFKKIDESKARGGYLTYGATIVATYIDEIPSTLLNVNGAPTLHRNTKVFYMVYMKFPTNIDIDILDVNVTSEVTRLLGVTQLNMDNTDTGLVHIEITTIADWPNTLTTENLALEIPTGLMLVTPTDHPTWPVVNNIALDWSACLNTSNTACKQVWSVVIDPQGACNFNGQYTLDFTVTTCRDQLEYCTKAAEQINFTIADSDRCGKVELFPSVTGTLHYMDSTYTNDVAVKNIGELAYFKTILVNEDNADNTITMEYEKIWFVNPTVSPVRIYLQQWDDSVAIPHVVPQYTANDGSPQVLNLTKAELFVDNDNMSFRVFLEGSVFKVNPDATNQFKFGAQIKIKYLGNYAEEANNYQGKRVIHEKRVVLEQEHVFSAPKKDATSSVSVVSPVRNPVTAVASSKTQSAAAPSTSTLAVNIAVPLASVAAVTLIAVVAYTIKTRKSFAKLNDAADAI